MKQRVPLLPAMAMLFSLASNFSARAAQEINLWDIGLAQAKVHRFSTLMTAQDVRGSLSSEEGLNQALDWCRKTAVTKVYLECFRDGYQAERSTLEKAMAKFRAAGFEVSGCVTTTKVGKPSTGWKSAISCYTHQPTQDKLQQIFEYAASIADEIMIDDFWFTDCECPDCEAARKAHTVTIGDRKYPVNGDTWEDYRCELMCRLSQERVLGPAKKVNPKARLIIKYPQWYDNFHQRGYEVRRETTDFDLIWVGTETRNYTDPRWGGTPQYEAYFIMRWLGRIGGDKCGGGWFDPYGTTERTYLEQARQTVLGGARESVLFCYGSLQHDTGPKNIEALRREIPELLETARQVGSRQIVGVATYKPINSHPEKEARVFDFVGMMGVPLAPCEEFPTNAAAAFFSAHALKDPDLVPKLAAFIKARKPVLITDGLAAAIKDRMNLQAKGVQILAVNGNPKRLLDIDRDELKRIREPLLGACKQAFDAPNRVGLYLFKDGSWVVENFNDDTVTVELNRKSRSLPARGWLHEWKGRKNP
jgi:hypothetical protein